MRQDADRQAGNELDVVRSSSWLLAASITMAAGNALFNLVLARRGGASHYSLAYPLLSLGTSSAAIGVGVQYAVTHSVLSGLGRRRAGRRFNRNASVAAALFLVLLACTVPLTRILHAESSSYVLVADALFAATFAVAAATGYLVALRRYAAIAVISALSAAVRIAAFVALARWTVVRGSLGASFIAVALAALAMWIYGRRRGPPDVARAAVTTRAPVSATVAIAFLLAALLALPSFEARHFLGSASAGAVSTALLFATVIGVVAGPIATTTYRSVLLGGGGQLVRSGARLTVLIGLLGVIGLVEVGPVTAGLLYGRVGSDFKRVLLLVGVAATLQALVGFLAWSAVARGDSPRPWIFGVSAGLLAEAAGIVAWHSSLAIAWATLVGSAAALVASTGASSFRKLREEADGESLTVSRRLLVRQAAEPPSSSAAVPVSVGVLAHNEREVIAMTVNAFLGQLRGRTYVDEVIVIVSGSTDGTPEVVERIAARDGRVRLVVQPERRGKLRAVEDFFQLATNDLCIESSGDVVPEPDLVERLCDPLLDDPEVGMTGPRVVSECLASAFVSRMHQVLWRLHDHVATRSPKLGETYAVRRRLVGPLPPVAGCDEVLVEAAVTSTGATLRYARDAVVHNFAPTSLAEYFDHRRRIHATHLSAACAVGYRPSTLPLSRCLRATAVEAVAHPSTAPALVACSLVELVARLCARRDVLVGETRLVWARTASSRLIVEDALADQPLPRAS